jgi:cell division protein FtsW
MRSVMGVPMPLVSTGASVLVTGWFAGGILLCFARSEPGFKQATTARPGIVCRSMVVMAGRGGRR